MLRNAPKGGWGEQHSARRPQFRSRHPVDLRSRVVDAGTSAWILSTADALGEGEPGWMACSSRPSSPPVLPRRPAGALLL